MFHVLQTRKFYVFLCGELLALQTHITHLTYLWTSLSLKEEEVLKVSNTAWSFLTPTANMQKCQTPYHMNYTGIHRDHISLFCFIFIFHSGSSLSLSELKLLYVKLDH